MFWGHGPLASVEYRFIPVTGVWGRAPRGSKDRAPGQGFTELKHLAFGRSIDAANLTASQKSGNVKNQIFVLFFLQTMKFNRPQYVTDFCEVMTSNKSDAGIT